MGIGRPNVKCKELEDRSNMDSFLKALSILQTVYFIAQCIACANQSLSTTTLEVATIDHVTCMLPTLYFWWEKPYDVTCPMELLIKDWHQGLAESFARMGITELQYCFLLGAIDLETDCLLVLHNIQTESTFAPYKPSSKKAPWDVTNYCMLLHSGLLFGSMHLLAWDYGFATSYGKWLWRGSSLSIIQMAGMIGVNIYCAHLIRNKESLRKLCLLNQNSQEVVYDW
jgi:hypothetical protein